MHIPESSFCQTVGYWRYVQAIHEAAERRNPDHLAGYFLPRLQRWRGRWISDKKIEALRSNRFYYYLIARTQYYDAVFLDAIKQGVQTIVNVGSGTDTRAYRFREQLERSGIQVCECDQERLITAKQRISQARWPTSFVSYLPLDLNAGSWPMLEKWLATHADSTALLMMEGVAPYVDANSFGRFLELLSRTLRPGSRVAYDFKISGVNDSFGRDGRSTAAFRLPAIRDTVAQYHAERNYRLTHMETSDELSLRLLPDLATSKVPLFREDVLIQLERKG
jgi:methyltransferase (TIGR00027 family)